MTAGEERELARRARSGDRAAADALASAVAAYVRKAARVAHLSCPSLDADEALGVGMEAVARALDHFDPARGIRWMTYVATAVLRALWEAKRAAARRRDHFPPDPDATDPSETPAAEPPSAMPLIDAVRGALDRLDAVEREVVQAAFGIDRAPESGASVRARLGLSDRRHRRALARALDRLGGVLTIESDGAVSLAAPSRVGSGAGAGGGA